MTDTIKNTVQDCNINFLLGSGLSRPFLATLGKIESLLTDLEGSQLEQSTKQLIRASIYKKYFDSVISANTKILSNDTACHSVLQNYSSFLRVMNSILLKRKGTILSKEINIFTTNVDIFLERALEDLGLEFNDGFNGRFSPIFSLSNFKKTRAKKSLHFDNVAELPVFNLLKLHGSLTWQIDAGEIKFSYDLKHVAEVATKTITPDHCVPIEEASTLDSLAEDAAGKTLDASTQAFMEAYERLLIVINPTKEKFKETLMNQTYYELLRLYSNELEKENTVLFAMGFSFADEHIREITLRAANSNPTLMIYVFAYDATAKADIEAHFNPTKVKNSNIAIIAPDQEDKDGEIKDKFQYDLPTINGRIFSSILQKISGERDSPAKA